MRNYVLYDSQLCYDMITNGNYYRYVILITLSSLMIIKIVSNHECDIKIKPSLRLHSHNDIIIIIFIDHYFL